MGFSDRASTSAGASSTGEARYRVGSGRRKRSACCVRSATEQPALARSAGVDLRPTLSGPVASPARAAPAGERGERFGGRERRLPAPNHRRSLRSFGDGHVSSSFHSLPHRLDERDVLKKTPRQWAGGNFRDRPESGSIELARRRARRGCCFRQCDGGRGGPSRTHFPRRRQPR
jgi:hypothetical protein